MEQMVIRFMASIQEEIFFYKFWRCVFATLDFHRFLQNVSSGLFCRDCYPFLFFSNFLNFQLCILLLPIFSIKHFLGKSPVVQFSIVAPVVKVSSALTTAKGLSSVITPLTSPSATVEVESRYKTSIALQAFQSANTLVWSSAVRLPPTFGAGPVRVEPTTTTTTSSLNGE